MPHGKIITETYLWVGIDTKTQASMHEEYALGNSGWSCMTAVAQVIVDITDLLINLYFCDTSTLTQVLMEFFSESEF